MLSIDLQNSELFIFIGMVVLLLLLFLILFLVLKKNSKKNKAKREFDNASKTIVDALGGIDNIISCSVSMSRVNVELYDYKLVENQQLTDAGVSGTVKTSKKLTKQKNWRKKQ